MFRWEEVEVKQHYLLDDRYCSGSHFCTAKKMKNPQDVTKAVTVIFKWPCIGLDMHQPMGPVERVSYHYCLHINYLGRDNNFTRNDIAADSEENWLLDGSWYYKAERNRSAVHFLMGNYFSYKKMYGASKLQCIMKTARFTQVSTVPSMSWYPRYVPCYCLVGRTWPSWELGKVRVKGSITTATAAAMRIRKRQHTTLVYEVGYRKF